MADGLLKDRLRQHEKAFDGLLSLIPAKMYYGNGEEPSDQWMQKKKSKSQRKADRIASLDPASELNKSVKEVLDDRARAKRKLRELEEEDEDDREESDDKQDDHTAQPPPSDDDDDIEGVEKEAPGQGLKKHADRPNKKQKTSDEPEEEAQEEDVKLSAKMEKKLAKAQRKLDKKAEKRKNKSDPDVDTVPHDTGAKQADAEAVPPPMPKSKKDKPSREPRKEKEPLPRKAREPTPPAEASDDNDEETPDDNDLDTAPFSGLASEAATPATPAESPERSTPDSDPASSTFDTNPSKPETASTETSISSVGATDPSAAEYKPKQLVVPADTTALRAKLAAKIAAMRAARNADREGKPVRTRQELIEARREKQAERKAHKKELRRKAKEEEDAKREEALASARNSPGSVYSPLLGIGASTDVDDGSANHFAFGRLAFADGTQMSSDLTYVKDPKKKKGPAANDAKAHLQKLEAQKERLAGMDEAGRKDIQEKETWLAARRKVEGIKVRDNESLLKKAIKRKEKTKQKSEREWKERKEGVAHAMKERQKKREDNINKRKEAKAMGKMKKKSAKKGRPGFEGRW